MSILKGAELSSQDAHLTNRPRNPCGMDVLFGSTGLQDAEQTLLCVYLLLDANDVLSTCDGSFC